MSFSQMISQRWSEGARHVTAEKSYSGDGAVSLDVAVPDGSTDMQVVVALDVSAIQLVFIKSTKDLTLKTNSSSTPDETIALKANVPYVWPIDDYRANLLATDITALYLTNASGAAAQFTFESVMDATP